MSNLKLNIQLKWIEIKYFLLSVVEFALIFLIAWFHNRFLEVLIIVPLFFIYTSKYEKQWHAITLFRCALYSVIVFYFVTLFIPSKNTSILVSVFTPYFITLISYHIRCYLDIRKDDQLKPKIKLLNEMSKEELNNLLKTFNFYENDINAIYAYLHRDRNVLVENIAIKYNMSRRTLYRLVNKAIKLHDSEN